MATWNRNCRSFQGTYSSDLLGTYYCDILKTENYKDCSECKFYEPIEKKILILKLGAMGDVLRTTTILSALKKKYGRNTHITWVVEDESKELLYNNPHIDKILIYNQETILRLQQEKFDILFSLEIAPPITLIANLVKTQEKFGYFFDSDGHPTAFNQPAVPYLETAFSDYKNREYKKTYQEMLFEICELNYEHQPYILNFEQESEQKKDKLIGINVGSAGRWFSKAWHPNNIKELIKKLPKEYKVILLGGPKEKDFLLELVSELRSENIDVITNNPNNTLIEFMSVIKKCNLIITGDTLALHLAIGLKVPSIALFFCTPDWQIEPYNLVEKITSPLFEKYFMDDSYHEDLTKSISAEEVLKKIKWNR